MLQPQPVPPTQAWPSGDAVQSPQVPDVPQVTGVGGAQTALTVTFGQQLPVQPTTLLQVVAHRCVALSQLEPIGQSLLAPGLLQPQNLPAWQTWPVDAVAQLMQAPPSAPHLASAVPGTQVPLSQHPPLHGCVGLQAVVQACIMTLHACWSPQSAALSQPQRFGPPGTNTQALPLLLPTQLVHIALPVAQASPPVPGTQVAPLQQPPLQAVWPAPHAGSHACEVVLHEVPNGQSAAVAQPHVPVPQLCPWAARVQSMQPWPDMPQALPAMGAQTLSALQQDPAPHMLPLPTLHNATHVPPEQAGVAPEHIAQAPPPRPHAASPSPATQLMPSQQPPRHIRPPAHDVEQTPVAGLHARPGGQSAALWQPARSPTTVRSGAPPIDMSSAPTERSAAAELGLWRVQPAPRTSNAATKIRTGPLYQFVSFPSGVTTQPSIGFPVA